MPDISVLAISGTSKLNFKETAEDSIRRETRTSADRIGLLNRMMVYIIYSRLIYDKQKNSAAYDLIRSIFILLNTIFTSSNHNTLHMPAVKQIIISVEWICPK